MSGVASGLRWLASPAAAVLAVFASCGLYVHLRGKARLGWLRQMSGLSTLTAPYSVLAYLFSAVPRTPYLDVALLPELSLLRTHWEAIRDEALALHDAGLISSPAGYEDAGFNSFFRHGWKRFYLRWYGETLPSAERLAPRTLELLSRLPSVRAAMFVRMAPRSRLPLHRDPYAGSLRYHLGLRTPNSDKCTIFVDGEPYFWRDGEDVLFDETYVHYARNDTAEDRFILFCDVERPMRSAAFARMNRLVGDHLMHAARTRNVDGESVGAINRAFGLLYPIRALGKRVRRRSKPVYYLLKYALLLSAIGLPLLALAWLLAPR
jgi:beta-hydroxylase